MGGAGGQLPDVGGVVPEVPGYRIERQLGRGSMGVVYLAEDVRLRRKVALKVLSPTLADDELFRKRFDQESQSAANLDHPSIVPVYAAGEAQGLLYIAMRYVSGGDLRALLAANGPLNLEQATSVIAPVADALDAAHAQGMVHRDVKPANILIDGRGGQQHYYLSDFGITKVVSSGRSLTSTGQIVGTVDYIAPEQIQGKPVDGRADLYALGCVLYQCLTGVVPFPREETTALMWAHVHEEPPPVTSRRPDLPPEIDYIVAKAMAKQPENRFATCRKLAIALRTIATDPAVAEGDRRALPAEPIDSPPPPVSTGMTSTYAPPSSPPVRAAKTAAPSGWRWWWLAAAGVLIALVGGSTIGVLNYLDSRFPNDAEQRLLDQVPLAMRDSCTRNTDAAYDAASVLASVTCTSDDEVNRVVFTKFTSDKALNDHYRLAVAATGIDQGSGDCRSAERAEGDYVSESAQTSGQVICYQQRGSSFIKWTDDKSQILGVATRTDPEYATLRDWWAGVVGIEVSNLEPTQAPSPPPPPPVVAAPAPAPDPPAPVPPAPVPPAPAPGTGGSEEQGEQGGEQGEEDSGQNEENPPTSPPTSETTTPPSVPEITLVGPVPAAPRPQQDGEPAPGEGGCTKVTNNGAEAEAGNYYACTVTETAPVFLPNTTEHADYIRARQYPSFLCQREGTEYSVENRTNNEWAWVQDSRVGVWVPTLFLAGGSNGAPVPGLPVCDSTSTTTTAPTTTTTAPPTTTTAPTTTTTAPTTTTTTAPTSESTGEPSNQGER